MTRIAPLALVAAAIFAAASVAAAERPLVILYPEVAEPERSVFTLMREGVQATAARQSSPVVALAISDRVSSAELAADIRAQDPSTVIVLGRRAWQLSSALDPGVPILVGGVELPVGGRTPSGVSLVPDPRIVLETLREVAPGIQRVIVVLDRTRTGWLSEPAEAAGRSLGLQIVIHEATTVGEAAAHYLNIFRYGNPKTDALWLLEAGRFITPDTLPTIIEESWSRSFVVFSNTLEHVRQGALFAHYPDPRPLGARLAARALRLERSAHGMAFLQDVQRAGNARVAAHLGTAVNSAKLQRFDLVLGQR